MFEPAPVIIRGFHITALHNAYGLMAAAAETGKPHACWAHHMSVGGAKVADQLVAIGFFVRRLDAKPGEIDSYRYRITAAGCAHISQPYLLEDSMSDTTPAPDVDQTSPAEPQPVDLSYPSKDAQPPVLKIVEPVLLVEQEQVQAADALYEMTPAEVKLLARIHEAGGKMQVAYSLDRVSLTKKGLIVLLHRAGLSDVPFVELTPRGMTAAALNAEMRIPSDDEADDADEYVRHHDEVEAEELQRAPIDEDDDPEEAEARLRHLFKRGDRVSWGGVIGTVDSQDVYPLVLFEAENGKLVKVSEHELTLLDTPVQVVEDDSPLDTKEIPAVELTGPADDLVKEQVLKNQTAEIVELRFQLAAIKRALADDDGVIPDDPALAIAGMKLRIEDQQRTVDGLSHAFDVLQEKYAVVEQERDVMKRDVTGLKLQIANLANLANGEMGVQHERTDRTTPADITARTLAGWTAWHKFNVGDELVVIWERSPKDKARSSRGRSAANRTTPAYTTPGVLQPDGIVFPAVTPGAKQPDSPTEPAYASSTPRAMAIEGAPEPLNPMSTVMASLTRNLHVQFEANPLPSYSDRPTR